jgi:hypothetical protein
MSNGGPFGWLGAAGSILGVVSTAIGIWVAVATQELKATSDRQKVRIDEQDAKLRISADQRASTSAQRDYLLKVYDKVLQAVETPNKRKQQVALALVESLDDPRLQEKLAKVFTASPTVEDPSTKSRAKQIQVGGVLSAAVAPQASGNPLGWDYDIFWCDQQPANLSISKQVVAAISNGDPAHGRIRLRVWGASQNEQSGYRVSGYEIRAEPDERAQAEYLKRIVDSAVPQPFTIKTKIGAAPTPWYLSVWVCPGS